MVTTSITPIEERGLPMEQQFAESVSYGSPTFTDDLCRTTLTDAEREEAIKRCGEAIVRHMTLKALALQRYDISGDFGDKGKADRHRLMAEEFSRCMAQLVMGRSPEQIARMESERGLG